MKRLLTRSDILEINDMNNIEHWTIPQIASVFKLSKATVNEVIAGKITPYDPDPRPFEIRVSGWNSAINILLNLHQSFSVSFKGTLAEATAHMSDRERKIHLGSFSAFSRASDRRSRLYREFNIPDPDLVEINRLLTEAANTPSNKEAQLFEAMIAFELPYVAIESTDTQETD